MATYFVISDIHSFYNEMIDALNKAGYQKDNKNHILISCGDLFDRGPDSVKCLEFINSIPDTNKVCIRGNHEDLLEDIFERGYFRHHDWHNQTNQTIYQLSNIYDNDEAAIEKCKSLPELKKYLDSCIDYFETDKYIFVHGWIPCKRNDPNIYHTNYIIREPLENWRTGDWQAARWDCGFDAWFQDIVIEDKTIVAGHWHTSYGHSKYHRLGKEFEDDWVRVWNNLYPESQIKNTAIFDIFKDKGIIAIDACTAYSGKVNCLKIGKQKPLDYWRKKNESC